MPCPMCGGSRKGCGQCEAGKIYITQCPLEIIDDATLEIIEMARAYYTGIPPVGTSYGEQSVMFLRAAGLIQSEINHWKNKLKIIG